MSNAFRILNVVFHALIFFAAGGFRGGIVTFHENVVVEKKGSVRTTNTLISGRVIAKSTNKVVGWVVSNNLGGLRRSMESQCVFLTLT